MQTERDIHCHDRHDHMPLPTLHSGLRDASRQTLNFDGAQTGLQSPTNEVSFLPDM